MALSVSRRAASLKPSSTVAVMNRAKALKAQGVDVLNFGAGEPDFNSPEVAKAAAIAALQANQTRYIETAGDAESRQLLADLLTTRNGIPGVTRDHVIITSGVKMALYLAFQTLFDAAGPDGGPDRSQQDLLLPVPAWVSFAPMAELAGARIVELPTTPESGFKITPQQLKAAITPRSRVVLINSPSNPTSTMYTPDELRALAAVVDEAARTIAPNLVIVADELYQNIVFGSVPFMSIGSVPSVAERTITINGPGKSFAMTGWRLGWASGSGEFGKAVIGAMTKLQGQTTTCVPAFCLAGMRSALTQCEKDLETMRAAFAKRADLIYSLLSGLPGLKLARPQGAFYVFPDISAHLGKTSAGGRKLAGAADFAAALLDEQQMAVVPGEDFGTMGVRHIRMSFACSEAQLTEGARRLGVFIAGLKG
ncbi:MAG: pyridoxal phosphate-dependent aminotransferase [Planctomycetaceae bacterium]|jgi:aspartate aminotransferase|nr:pyridoxal phosphate-dependent aminotransferase [Phycisphaerales bacterium]MCE2653643.1 pyridoxal phosphate-dependent aminotransferase [Planctomycetaceae bacterium]